MSSGRRGRKRERKAQRRSKWQAEQRFSKRIKRQDPRRRGAFEVIAREIAEEMEATPLLHLLVRDGAPGSPYAARKEA